MPTCKSCNVILTDDYWIESSRQLNSRKCRACNDRMLRAYTAEGVERRRKYREAWLDKHPGQREVLEKKKIRQREYSAQKEAKALADSQ